jgi:hypothetical protein
LEQGQSIQMGYFDVLMTSTTEGAISVNVLVNYADDTSTNTLPQNVLPASSLPDAFFNSIIPTYQSQLGGLVGTKYWQRVYCPTRGAFITLQFNLSNAQLVGVEQESEVCIDSQILWMRPSGRLQTF